MRTQISISKCVAGLLAMLVTCCAHIPGEQSTHDLIVGSWTLQPYTSDIFSRTGSVTFYGAGRFHGTESCIISNKTTLEISDGRWDAKDGFIYTTITNCSALGATICATNRSKITHLDKHTLRYGDEYVGSSYYR